MAFNATFHNISVILWRSVLLVAETGVPVNKLKPSFSQIVMKPRQKVHMHPWPILIIFCHKFVFTFFEGIISPLILV
jgi:hypothetical protein